VDGTFAAREVVRRFVFNESIIMQKIFISYSRLDEKQAKQLYESLFKKGFYPWLDKISLLPGQIWDAEIKNEIKKSNFIILLLSQNSINKEGYFHKEIQLAIDTLQTIPQGKIFIIPARLDDCIVPESLQIFQWVDMFPNWNKGCRRIFESLNYQRGQEIISKPIEDLAPLPKDVAIIPPADTLPKNLAAFSGHWIGRWGDVLPSQLIVEEITERNALVIYSWGESSSGSFKEGWTRIQANVTSSGILKWGGTTDRGITKVKFRLDENNKVLLGIFERNQRVSKIVMRQK